MSIVYKVNMRNVTVNLYSDQDDATGARLKAEEEYDRLTKKYPDSLVEVIRVTSDVIVKSR